MSPYVTRFAPSPTGYLHLGHAASALFAYDWAKQHGAEYILRIEDIDSTRCKPEFETALLEDLNRLGLHWPTPVRRQSDHFPQYAKALSNLESKGLLYRCFLTRKQLLHEMMRAPHGYAESYQGPQRPMDRQYEQDLLAAGKPFAWRLSLDRACEHLGKDWDKLGWQETGHGPDNETGWIKAQPKLPGDVILARKDIHTSYHLAVTHDDAIQEITHIVRGQDLFESTHIHVVLQALLGLPTPIYHHHGLLVDAAGNRLAKRDGSTSLRSLWEGGASPKEIRKLARL